MVIMTRDSIYGWEGAENISHPGSYQSLGPNLPGTSTQQGQRGIGAFETSLVCCKDRTRGLPVT